MLDEIMFQVLEKQITEKFSEPMLEKIIRKVLKKIKAEDEPELLTIPEVCKELKISKPTCHRLMNEGRLKFKKIGRLTRITREDLNYAVSIEGLHKYGRA